MAKKEKNERIKIEVGRRTITYKPFVESNKIESLLAINPESLNEELMNQANAYAYVAATAEAAKDKVSVLKLRLEILQAGLDKKYREKLSTEGRLTENTVLNRIKANRKNIAAITALNKAKYEAGVITSFVRAFEQRNNMLVSLASNFRSEMDLGITIKKREQQKQERMKRVKKKRR